MRLIIFSLLFALAAANNTQYMFLQHHFTGPVSFYCGSNMVGWFRIGGQFISVKETLELVVDSEFQTGYYLCVYKNLGGSIIQKTFGLFFAPENDSPTKILNTEIKTTERVFDQFPFPIYSKLYPFGVNKTFTIDIVEFDDTTEIQSTKLRFDPVTFSVVYTGSPEKTVFSLRLNGVQTNIKYTYDFLKRSDVFMTKHYLLVTKLAPSVFDCKRLYDHRNNINQASDILTLTKNADQNYLYGDCRFVSHTKFIYKYDTSHVTVIVSNTTNVRYTVKDTCPPTREPISVCTTSVPQTAPSQEKTDLSMLKTTNILTLVFVILLIFLVIYVCWYVRKVVPSTNTNHIFARKKRNSHYKDIIVEKQPEESKEMIPPAPAPEEPEIVAAPPRPKSVPSYSQVRNDTTTAITDI